MELVKVSCGRERIVLYDECDTELVRSCTWSITQNGNKLYAVSKIRGQKSLYLHRAILGVTDPTIEVDHEDGNGLNCMRINLRVATKSQNLHNRPIAGLSWSKEKQRWKSRIKVDGVEYFLGYFSDPEAAYTYRRLVIPKMFPHLIGWKPEEKIAALLKGE